MFQIFKPFEKVTKNSDVFICSWNLTDYQNLKITNDYIIRAKRKRILVGFSKESHDCKELKNKVLEYMRNGFTVKVLPSFHAKIWTIDRAAYVGSCNWCPDSLHNYMHKTIITKRLKNFVDEFWKKAYNVTGSSKLWLLPQK